MTFIQFLIDTPIIAFLLLLAMLVTIVPITASLLFRNKPGHPDEISIPMKKSSPICFQGTQMDIAILIFGLLLLYEAINLIHKEFFC